jgi:hypothetical protein
MGRVWSFCSSNFNIAMSSSQSDRVLRPRINSINYNLEGSSSHLSSSGGVNEMADFQTDSDSREQDSYRRQPANCRSIFKLNRRTHNHIKKYHAFRLERFTFYCAICVKLLYVKEARTRYCKTPLHQLPCNEWGKSPIVQKTTS